MTGEDWEKVQGTLHYAGQQVRAAHGQGYPGWMQAALDAQRAKDTQNRVENPALWQKLNEIEAKLDEVLRRLPAP